ncbi:MAG TPA: hypothetical protein VKT28_18125 [Puia sp.]|nr:hypothetical protein [Puia sp.]
MSKYSDNVINHSRLIKKQKNNFLSLLLFVALIATNNNLLGQAPKNALRYTVSILKPATHSFHVELNCSSWAEDTINLKMPQWMPGYYQIMNYAKEVENFSVKDKNGKVIGVKNINENIWQIVNKSHGAFRVSYDVKTNKQFVANSYVDSGHAYIIPEAAFLYIDGHLNTAVNVKLVVNKEWNKIATGLQYVSGKVNEFSAPDFDILYDCPILAGNLEELPSFKINGIEHRFIGYQIGDFDKEKFMASLKKIVEAGIAVIGDIPYKQYTFIAMGNGRGGIEHLNNCTVGFNGNELSKEGAMNRMMNFLAHEYFHHYNVKRIRPYELGPFDYDNENKTNLLWVSEGLTVYYEYMLVKRAGLVSDKNLFADFENNISTLENNPGRLYQSLTQASYETWSDGPFGKQGEEANKSISYYEKGPVVGLLLDFEIRHATANKKSLDDVMRLVYWQYYKKLQRGFTDAEFQQACEAVAGTSLNKVFEYVYTVKEFDYNSYLSFAGLKIDKEKNADTGKQKFSIHQADNVTADQSAILKAWLGN